MPPSVAFLIGIGTGLAIVAISSWMANIPRRTDAVDRVVDAAVRQVERRSVPPGVADAIQPEAVRHSGDLGTWLLFPKRKLTGMRKYLAGMEKPRQRRMVH